MPQPAVIHDLRARIAVLEGVARPHGSTPFGVGEIDRRLPGGGIVGGALHEILGNPELCDDAAATVFLAGILARIEGPVFWCLRWRDLFAPALHLAGLHPDRVIHVEAGSDTNVLLAMEECLRHAGIAGVVGEVTRYSTTASKRLQLAAEGSGVTAFVFRRASDPAAGADASLGRQSLRRHVCVPPTGGRRLILTPLLAVRSRVRDIYRESGRFSPGRDRGRCRGRLGPGCRPFSQ
jgi:protein ImuA